MDILAVDFCGGTNVHRGLPSQFKHLRVLLVIGAGDGKIAPGGIGYRSFIKVEIEQVAVRQQHLAGPVVTSKLLGPAVKSVSHGDIGTIKKGQGAGGCVAGVTDYVLRLADFPYQSVHRLTVGFVEHGVICQSRKAADAKQENRSQSQAAD